jgi:serine/threonine-protein kinase HipA
MADRAIVYWQNKKAGVLSEQEDGYMFQYIESYVDATDAQAISLTLPLRRDPYVSKTMFPFFDGLIPEGWLLDVTVDIWKLDPRDRMGLLMSCCRDCIGAVSIIPDGEDTQ